MLPNKLEKKSAPQYHEVRNEDAKTQSFNSQFKESKTNEIQNYWSIISLFLPRGFYRDKLKILSQIPISSHKPRIKTSPRQGTQSLDTPRGCHRAKHHLYQRSVFILERGVYEASCVQRGEQHPSLRPCLPSLYEHEPKGPALIKTTTVQLNPTS